MGGMDDIFWDMDSSLGAGYVFTMGSFSLMCNVCYNFVLWDGFISPMEAWAVLFYWAGVSL